MESRVGRVMGLIVPISVRSAEPEPRRVHLARRKTRGVYGLFYKCGAFALQLHHAARARAVAWGCHKDG